MGRKKRRLKFRLFMIAATIGVLLVMATPAARQLFDQNGRIASEEEKLAALLDENSRLEERLARLRDPDYVEKLAREQLEMVKPGEISYVVVPPEASEEDDPPPPPPKPWYEKAWNWLKGLVTKE